MDTETGRTDEIALQSVSDAVGRADRRRPSPHGGDVPVLGLNDRWRIAHDGSLQWILQVREGKKWIGRRFHGERGPLLRSIGELCGAVDSVAIAVIAGWPSRYRPDFAAPASPAATAVAPTELAA